jgi:hypothetical protein
LCAFAFILLISFYFYLACGLAVLKILEGGILKNNFLLGGKGGSSFAIFGLCVGLCELQMCLH